MKKLIAFLAVICWSITLWGQECALLIDARNAFFGSDKNSPGLNLKVQIMDSWNYDSPLHLGMEYEVFDLINYQQWTFARFEYRPSFSLTLLKFESFIGVGFSQIYHETTYSHDAMTYGFYSGARYFFSDHMGFVIEMEIERAPDISQDWRYSGFVGLTYEISRN
jgi:hypothetical protein